MPSFYLVLAWLEKGDSRPEWYYKSYKIEQSNWVFNFILKCCGEEKSSEKMKPDIVYGTFK